MSLADTVTYDDHIKLPAGIAAAFDRDMRIVANSTSFVDRVPAIAGLADTVIHWRWASVITPEQYGFLLRKLRRAVEGMSLGEITDRDINSAVEVEQREAETADILDSLGVPSSH